MSSTGHVHERVLPPTQAFSTPVVNLLPRGLDKRVRQLFILAFVNEIGRIPVSIYLPLFLYQNYHAPLIVVGLGLTLSTGSSAFFQMVGGVFADRFGRRATMLLSLCGKVLILSSMAFGAATLMSVWTLILLYASSEALSGIFQTASGTMISDVVSADRRVEAYGLYHIGVNVAFTLGALIGGLLTALLILFIMWIGCSIISIGIVLSITESGVQTSNRVSLGSTFSVAKDRFLLGFGVVSFGAGLVANQMGTTFALYTTTIIEISRSQLGSLYFLNGMLVILFQYPLSKLVLRYRLSSLLAAGATLRAGGFLLVAFSQSFALLVVVMTALTLGEMFQAPSAPSYAALLAPEDKRGEYLGFQNWWWNSGQAISPLLGGFLLASMAPDYFRIWILVFGFGSLCAVSYLWLAKATRAAFPKIERIL